MENAATGIMGHLRDTTRALHTEAESRPLQRAMAKGTLPPGSYVMYLGQLRHLHPAPRRYLPLHQAPCQRTKPDDLLLDALYILRQHGQHLLLRLALSVIAVDKPETQGQTVGHLDFRICG